MFRYYVCYLHVLKGKYRKHVRCAEDLLCLQDPEVAACGYKALAAFPQELHTVNHLPEAVRSHLISTSCIKKLIYSWYRNILFLIWLGLVYSSRRSAHCQIFLNTGRTNKRWKNLICPLQGQLIWGWWSTRHHLFYQVSRAERRGGSVGVVDGASVKRSEASGRVGRWRRAATKSISLRHFIWWPNEFSHGRFLILISAFELFLTALVKEEMSQMPRGVHFMAMRGGSLASARGKTVAGIPAFMLKTYEKNKQPGLKSGLTGERPHLFITC